LYGLLAYFIIIKLSELARRFFDYTDFEIMITQDALGGNDRLF